MTDSMERSLGRLEGKVDSILASQSVTQASLDRLESRTSAMERWKAQMMGGAAVAGFLGGFIVRLVFG